MFWTNDAGGPLDRARIVIACAVAESERNRMSARRPSARLGF
jgi:hypothetical protein